MSRVLPWDQLAVTLAKDFSSGRHEAVDDALLGVRDSDRRLDLIESLVDGASKKQLTAWANAFPQSEHAAIAAAIRAIDDAWDERGYETGDKLNEAQIAAFLAKLAEVVPLLERARRLAPNDPLPYAIAIRLHRSMGNLDALKAAWERGLEINPEFRRLYYEFLVTLSPRWYGEVKDLFGFVNEQTRNAAGGDFRHALIAVAHCELLLTYLAGQNETADFLKISREYFAQIDVRRDVLHAAYATLGPDPAAWPSCGVRELNYLAFSMALAEQPVDDLFTALDGRFTSEPWALLGEPDEVFERFDSHLRGRRRAVRTPRGDKEAESRVGGIFTMIGLPILAIALLYFGIADGIRHAHADPTKPSRLSINNVTKFDSFMRTQYFAYGEVVEEGRSVPRRVDIFANDFRSLRKGDVINIYPIRGAPGQYMAESKLRSGGNVLRLPFITVTIPLIVGAAILLLWSFLLFAPMRRRIESQ